MLGLPRTRPGRQDGGGGMKFRKRSIEVEAMQFDGTNGRQIRNWAGKESVCQSHYEPKRIIIRTLEGHLYAQIGDWVIKGIAGEIYPCKQNIFEQTYDKIEAKG